MVTLVTYLPFYRIHEINEYFVKNMELIRPRNAIVYIDNVYHERQKELINKIIPNNIEVKVGNWRNRNNTWLSMFRDFHNLNDEIIVIDSDNVVEPVLPEIHEKLRHYTIYSILDEESWSRFSERFLIRSRKIGNLNINNVIKPIYAYKVYDDSIKGIFTGKRGPTFFIGPKQAIAFMKIPDIDILSKVERAFNNVDLWLRNFISDETFLGVTAHLMGVVEVPWTIASHHYHHGSTLGKATELLVAAAHYQFGKELFKEFGKIEFKKYEIKHAFIIN